VLLTAVPFLRRMTWQLPDTYHSAGHGRGTATLKFYEGRDILHDRPDQASSQVTGRGSGGTAAAGGPVIVHAPA
jgi:hypothetical protein